MSYFQTLSNLSWCDIFFEWHLILSAKIRWSTRFKEVLKTSSRHAMKTSLTRLQRNNFSFSKTCRRRLEDILQDVIKLSWKGFEDALEDEKLLRWKRLQDVFKTFLQDILKICLEDDLRTCLEYQNALEKSKIFTGDLYLTNLNLFLTNLYLTNLYLMHLRQINPKHIN